MTTPTGTIKASDINTELKRSSTANIRMGEADVRALARVPSGTIRMSDLRGKSIVTGAAADVFASANPGSTAKAGLWWGNNGVLQTIENDVFLGRFSNFWSFVFDNSLGNDYQLNVAQTGGSGGVLTSDFSLNTWVNLSTAKRMDLAQSSSGFVSRTFTAQIREASTSTVVASTSFSLSAEIVF